MSYRPLLGRLDVLIAAATSPSTDDVELRHAIERYYGAKAGRATAGPKGAAARSDLVRGRIRSVWGVRPLHTAEGHPLPVALLLGQLQRAMRTRGVHADVRTMRDELLVLQAEEATMLHSGSGLQPVQQQSTYCSTQSST